MPTARAHDADIAYEVTGDGEPVLLIMGLGADATGWALQVPALARAHRVITFDNRGAGGSTTTPGPYTTAQMAEDARAVLDAAGAERAHVVASSLGGAIAQELALAHPARVRSLTLAVTWAGPSEWRSRLYALQEQVAAIGRAQLVALRMHLVFSPPLFERHPDLMERIQQTLIEGGTTDEGFLAQMAAAAAHDARARLGALDVPTQVFGARRDALVPVESTEEVASLIPGARFEAYGCAHALHFEEAERFNHAVTSFIEEVGP